jgi:hypothetical protein
MTLSKKFDNVDPSFSRKVELLEALLFGFIEHSLNTQLLDQIETHIQEFHGAVPKDGILQ